MSSLYEINQAILDTIDLETGEIVDTAAFDQLQMERDEKIENIALYIKNLRSESESLKAEAKVFTERQKRAENKADSLTKYLDSVLNGKKFKSVRAEVSYRKSTALNVDETKLSAKWMREVPATHVVDKVEITKAIKAGENIEGAELIERNNISIK